jgi:hypothetical protein
MDKIAIQSVYSCQRRLCYLGDQTSCVGLPHLGILVNKLLQKRLAPHGYYACVNTHRLWKHETHPITFSLVVDDFWN